MSNPLNAISQQIIGAAIAVHGELGPGLLENTYEVCLAFELLERGLTIERQKSLPVVYRDQRLDLGFRIDLLVENEIIVEVKSVERVQPVHSAQMRSYLRLSGRTLGLLINFNVKLVAEQGVTRIANNFQE